MNNASRCLPSDAFLCVDRGLLLPLLDRGQWAASTRAVFYFIGLLYSFVGVAVIADVFMCAIERITSSTRKIRVVSVAVPGQPVARSPALYRDVLIWNPTVANLTLMALGSSAPEILLSIIEIVGKYYRRAETSSLLLHLLCWSFLS
ncbi:unnamed protein product [Soboliphyme baturini]|uniref:Na_Ca_ex domain-containing protein n=1 Tax=Soboliphyme baturini TaxID=241478 RepID=A0A183J472_9BILA|nr:unnamed protein product [Soboliphyme baturini]